MKQTVIPFKLPLIDVGTVRSPGLHLSQLIQEIALYTGDLDPEWEGADLHPETINIGIAFEEALAKFIHREIVYHPDEMHVDGVAMSMDGLTIIGDETSLFHVDTLNEGDTVLHEFKTTRKSSRKGDNLDLLPMWMWQIKGYLYGCSSLTCFLHVLWLNGDYTWDKSDAGKPTYTIYRLDFTEIELMENWEMLMQWKHVNHDKKKRSKKK
jgi:hypothetical protein